MPMYVLLLERRVGGGLLERGWYQGQGLSKNRFCPAGEGARAPSAPPPLGYGPEKRNENSIIQANLVTPCPPPRPLPPHLELA